MSDVHNGDHVDARNRRVADAMNAKDGNVQQEMAGTKAATRTAGTRTRQWPGDGTQSEGDGDLHLIGAVAKCNNKIFFFNTAPPPGSEGTYMKSWQLRPCMVPKASH